MAKGTNGGARPNSGRPKGTKTTETSDVLVRLREKTGLEQLAQAQELGLPYSTYRRYETQKLIPISGIVREVILRAAKLAGVSFDEQEASKVD